MSQSRVDRRIKKVECDRLSVVIEDELKDYYDSTNNIYEDALMDIGVSNDDPLTDDPLFENDIEITDNKRELHSESDFDINDEESSDNYDLLLRERGATGGCEGYIREGDRGALRQGLFFLFTIFFNAYKKKHVLCY